MIPEARRGACALLLSVVLLAGCNPFRRNKPRPPQPPAPPPKAARLPEPAKPKPVTIPDPPEVQAGAPPLTSPPTQPGQLPPPPSGARPAPKSAKPGQTVEQPDASQHPQLRGPQLGQVMDPRQRQQYERAIDEALDRARRALANIQARQLSQEQAAALQRVQTFVKQAEQARHSDLQTARGFAERADALARDLLRSMR